MDCSSECLYSVLFDEDAFISFRLEMQVLTRFEQENGGELLVATVCLLETSSRGLLETELLTILGDEENLMPRHNEDNTEKGFLL